MRDQITTVRSTVGTLRRRSRALFAAAFVGLAAGVAFVLVQPPLLTSTTLVLLPTPASTEGSSSDIDTQVEIAVTATVLQQAGQAIAPALPARVVKKMIKAAAPTNQLIQIDATSTNAVEAQTLSQAVADSYVAYVNKTAQEVSSAALTGLKVRRDQLQAQIEQLQDEIAAARKREKAVKPNSPDSRKEAQLLAQLRTQEANLSLQRDKVEDKIAIGVPLGSSATIGTSVIQQATDPQGLSTWVRLAVWAPLGALVCVILAGVVLLAMAWRDNRVRLRDEIADAVGSPVLASVRSRPQQSTAGWSMLLRSYEATPVDSWAFRQVLRRLVPADRRAASRVFGDVDHPQALTMLSLSGDQRGLAVGPQLAAYSSSLGVITRLVAALGHESAAALWAACAGERGSALRPGLYIDDVPDGREVQLTINLVVVDREKPDLAKMPGSVATILAIAAGTATEQELARVAVAADDVGRRIDGVVVADPDKTDHTSGRQTLDERSRRPALPTRLTGIASSGGTAAALARNRL